MAAEYRQLNTDKGEGAGLEKVGVCSCDLDALVDRFFSQGGEVASVCILYYIYKI